MSIPTSSSSSFAPPGPNLQHHSGKTSAQTDTARYPQAHPSLLTFLISTRFSSPVTTTNTIAFRRFGGGRVRHANLLLTVAAIGVVLSSHLATSLPANRGETTQTGLSQISRSLSIFLSPLPHPKLLFYWLTDTVIHNESNCYSILDSKNPLL